MTPLPLIAPPIAGESLRGYLVRLADLNGYETIHWLGSRHGGRAIALGEKLSIERVAALTEVSISSLQNMSYRSNGPNQHKFLGSTVCRRLLQLERFKFCPLCISEAPFHRAFWDLTITQVCPTHRCALLSRCPRCSAKLNWRRASISHCRCGMDFRECAIQAIDGEFPGLLAIERFGLGDCAVLHPELAALTLGDLVELLLALSAYAGRRGSRAGFLSFNYDEVPIHLHIEDGWRIARLWPEGFNRLLDQIRAARPASRSIARSLGPIYNQTAAKRQTGRFWPILHGRIENYVHSRWEGALVARKHRIVRIDGMAAITVNEAARRLGRGYRFTRTLLDEGKLTHRIYDGPRGTPISVNLADVEAASRRATAKEVANALGIGRRRVAAFIRKIPPDKRDTALYDLLIRAEAGEKDLLPDRRKRDLRL